MKDTGISALVALHCSHAHGDFHRGLAEPADSVSGGGSGVGEGGGGAHARDFDAASGDGPGNGGWGAMDVGGLTGSPILWH